jgi:hypothetical protein
MPSRLLLRLRLPPTEPIGHSSPGEYPEDGERERNNIGPALVVCEDDFCEERANGESDYRAEDGQGDLHERSVTDRKMRSNASEADPIRRCS